MIIREGGGKERGRETESEEGVQESMSVWYCVRMHVKQFSPLTFSGLGAWNSDHQACAAVLLSELLHWLCKSS